MMFVDYKGLQKVLFLLNSQRRGESKKDTINTSLALIKDFCVLYLKLGNILRHYARLHNVLLNSISKNLFVITSAQFSTYRYISTNTQFVSEVTSVYNALDLNVPFT